MGLTQLLLHMRARLALIGSGERVDVDELAQVFAGWLPDVDLTNNADRDGAERSPGPDPLTPLELLEATPGVLVSRDFRAAGKGAEWDRCRKYDPKIHGYPTDKSRGQSRGVLDWAKVSTIVIHTAGTNGLHPDRWLGVPCHAAVASDATAVLCHELNTYLFAAHAANRYSCSLEIAGNRTITDAQIVVARALLRYMAAVLRSRRPLLADGSPMPLHIAPHKFSHRSRVKDCDTRIWHEVGEWGMDELGLLLGPVVGSGTPLPF
jgi:hypothetical protein